MSRALVVACLGYLAVVVLGAVLAPVLAPYAPTATDLDQVLSGPRWTHPLGTDGLGRDVLSRILHGGRVTLTDASVTVLTVLVAGVGSGLVAGFAGGWADRVFTWVTDVLLAIPVIVTLLGVLAVVGENRFAAMIALGVLTAPGVARVVRGATLAVRQEPYVAAARVSGLRTRHLIARHVLPRVAGPIIVQLTLLAGGALLIGAGLAYLGFGAPPPTPSWGGMIADAAAVIERQPWLLVPPGVVLGLAILALGIVGDAVRDATAPGSPRAAPAPPPRPNPPTARTTPTGLLSISDLTVTIAGPAGSRVVVETVSLTVDRGQTVGLVGESGCGKSMTARAVLGLLPAGGVITSGQVVFDGNHLTTPGAARPLRGRRIALISQDPVAALDPVYPAGAQVAELVRRHHGGSRAAARARALDLLAEVNLPDPRRVAASYPHELSGGMAQRVGIALALAGEPDLLVADEPTTALDATVRVEILDLLRRLQVSRAMAILLISHDWSVIAGRCARTYVMYAGHIVEAGPTAELLAAPRHPYTAGLLAARPATAPPGARLTAIPGTVPDPADRPPGCHFTPRCALATAVCLTNPVPLHEARPAHHTRCWHHERLAPGGDHEPAPAGHP